MEEVVMWHIHVTCNPPSPPKKQKQTKHTHTTIGEILTNRQNIFSDEWRNAVLSTGHDLNDQWNRILFLLWGIIITLCCYMMNTLSLLNVLYIVNIQTNVTKAR